MPPVVAGIGAAATWVAGLGAGALFALNLGVAFVATQISAKLARGKSNLRLNDQDRARTVTGQDTTDARRLIYGEARVAGQITFFGTSGTENEYLWYVVRWCDHEVDSFQTYYLDGVSIDPGTQIDGSGDVTRSEFVSSNGTKLVRITSYDGTQTTVDSALDAAFTEIGSTVKGQDIAYTIFRLLRDPAPGGTDPTGAEKDVWSEGPPQTFEAKIRGRLLYDTRTTLTEWSANPALCIRDYLTDTTYGLGIDSADIADTVTNATANICEQSVTVWDGVGGTTTQDRFTCNGLVLTDQAHGTVLEQMLSSMAGTLLYQQGTWRIYAGAYDSPSFSLTEADLAGPISVQATAPRAERYNAVKGTYFDPDQDGNRQEFLARTSATYETQDGGERIWKDLELPFTSDPQAAQRLALIALKQSRNWLQFSAEFKGSAFEVGVYDTVDLTVDELGWSAEVFRIVEAAYNPDRGTVTLVGVAESSTAYTYTAPPGPNEEIDEPGSAPTSAQGPGTPPAVTGLAITAGINANLIEWTNPVWPWSFTVEVYASQTNSRPTTTAGIVATTQGESVSHSVGAGETWYYWVLVRDDSSGLVSAFNPIGTTTTGVTWGQVDTDQVADQATQQVGTVEWENPDQNDTSTWINDDGSWYELDEAQLAFVPTEDESTVYLSYVVYGGIADANPTDSASFRIRAYNSTLAGYDDTLGPVEITVGLIVTGGRALPLDFSHVRTSDTTGGDTFQYRLEVSLDNGGGGGANAGKFIPVAVSGQAWEVKV